jgi:very-short-patch-repair endonuclease
MTRKTEPIILECKICNKTFIKEIPTFRKIEHYPKTCSKKCYSEMIHRIKSPDEDNRLNKICPICNTPYTTTKKLNKKTCSRKCGVILFTSKTKYVSFECKYCKNIKRMREKDYNKLKFVFGDGACQYCSKRCVLMHKNKSKIEETIKNILSSFDIIHEQEYEIDTFFYDFYLPFRNILIECQGDYWHGNLDIMKNLNKNQEKTKNSDERKRNVAIQQNYKILYFWENDIKNNINIIENIIFRECVEKIDIRCPKCNHFYYIFDHGVYKCNACGNEWSIDNPQ